MSEQSRAFLFLGTEADRPHLHQLKPLMGDAKCYVDTRTANTIAEVSLYCKSRGITGVFTTQPSVLKKLADRDKVSIDNYAGSFFRRADLDWVILDPLEHTQTIPYGKFLLGRFTSKLVYPEKWLQVPSFNWEMFLIFVDESYLIRCIRCDHCTYSFSVRGM